MTDSVLLQPRGMVIVDGATVPADFVSWEIDNNSHFAADVFRVNLVLSSNPEQTIQSQLDFWASLSNGEVEILGGFPSDPNSFSKADLTSFLTGYIDEIEIDVLKNKVEIYGRDFTSFFLDSKTSEKFQNKRASEIAQILAERHGLSAQVVPTSSIVGTYYQIDHVSLQSDRTEWDLLTYLAQHEGYDCFVVGRTLYFQPDEPQGTPFEIDVVLPGSQPVISSNAIDLKFQRNLTLAADVKVVVHSWNSKQYRGFTVTAQAHRAKNQLNAPKGNRPAQVYTKIKGGLSAQDAQKLANSIAESISLHEIVVDANLPADATLTARTPILIKGTGTAFDQTYYPDSVIRILDWDEGFEMRVHAKNHGVESTTTP